jgi:hypothetical protein
MPPILPPTFTPHTLINLDPCLVSNTVYFLFLLIFFSYLSTFKTQDFYLQEKTKQQKQQNQSSYSRLVFFLFTIFFRLRFRLFSDSIFFFFLFFLFFLTPLYLFLFFFRLLRFLLRLVIQILPHSQPFSS